VGNEFSVWVPEKSTRQRITFQTRQMADEVSCTSLAGECMMWCCVSDVKAMIHVITYTEM